MKPLLFLIFLVLCYPAWQFAKAGDVTDLDTSKCIAPSKEEAEFEPSLCPADLPAIDRIKISEHIQDEKDADFNANDCHRFFKVTEEQVVNFMNSANRISASDMHAKLPEISPCYVSGDIYFKDGTKGSWTLQSSLYLAKIQIPQTSESINLYCPKSCGFIPTYE